MAEHRIFVDRHLSAADAELRRRITVLSVHIRCGRLRGPAHRISSTPGVWSNNIPMRWQSCRCEDAPEVWKGCDVSRATDLCSVCARGTAGGMSRWAWLACEHCREVNSALERVWSRHVLALGRHSLMNRIGVRGGASASVQREQAASLVDFARGQRALFEWGRAEFRRLAGAFPPDGDVPLAEWQQQWPPGRAASIDAFERMLGVELPLRR